MTPQNTTDENCALLSQPRRQLENCVIYVKISLRVWFSKCMIYRDSDLGVGTNLFYLLLEVAWATH